MPCCGNAIYTFVLYIVHLWWCESRNTLLKEFMLVVECCYGDLEQHRSHEDVLGAGHGDVVLQDVLVLQSARES